MKKILSIVLIIQLLSIMVVNANGATTTNATGTIQMSMDGKMMNFKVAQLNINGQLIQSDVPPVIHNDRTLVPLRIIMENIKASVNWNQVTQEVTVKTNDKEIVLQINNGVAKVNGANTNLPDGVAPMLINGRTMVPIRFVAETIGLGVDWDSKTQTVLLKYKPVVSGGNVRASAINVKNGNYPEIRIKTTKDVEYQVSHYENPTRIVIDFKNVIFSLEDKKNLLADGTYRLPLVNSAVKVIRMSQFKTEPMETRLVLELEATANHRINYDQSTGEMVIGFDVVTLVKSVKAEQQNMKEVIVIQGDGVENYKVSRLKSPERLVVDILDAEIDGGTYRLDIDGRIVKSVRVAQFDPTHPYRPDDRIVRIVIDLQDKDQYADFDFVVQGDQLMVHLEGNSLGYEATGWTTSKLILRGNVATNYQVNPLANTNTLEILVPRNHIDLEFNDMPIGDHMVNNIRVEGNGSNQHYRILVEMAPDVSYRLISSLVTKDLVLEFKNNNKYREVLVIIDPGHGEIGNHIDKGDPGAVSTSLNLKESVVVLDVSKRLNKLLQDAGFRTYMTRSTGDFISLEDRAAVANQLNGDIFVSVHANSVTDKNVSGIENLYYPSEKDPLDSRDNKRLAQTFQTTMINDLGGRDRGIKPRDGLVVLNRTTMPGVLSEIGFMSNPDEGAKIATEAYRQKVAESLFKAIVKHFEETRFK